MANPLLNNEVFSRQNSYGMQTMTLSGTINKSIFLWFILVCGAYFSWTHPQITAPFLLPLVIGALIVAIITILKKTASPFLSPIYALLEGLFLGVVSLYFEKSYPGIVVNAVIITTGIMFCMLAAYRAGILRATPMFYKCVLFSMLAVLIVYIFDLIFGVPLIHSTGMGGVLITLAIVVIASLNLVIDFDLIERNVAAGAPKCMEWYASFALMITLVWLYIEVLRLLAKTRN